MAEAPTGKLTRIRAVALQIAALATLLAAPAVVALAVAKGRPPRPLPWPSVEARQIIAALEGTLVQGKAVPFDEGRWRLTGSGLSEWSGEFMVVFEKEDPGVNDTWVRFVLTADGDVADLYSRVTGKRHPALDGELSVEYRMFLEDRGW